MCLQLAARGLHFIRQNLPQQRVTNTTYHQQHSSGFQTALRFCFFLILRTVTAPLGRPKTRGIGDRPDEGDAVMQKDFGF